MSKYYDYFEEQEHNSGEIRDYEKKSVNKILL